MGVYMVSFFSFIFRDPPFFLSFFYVQIFLYDLFIGLYSAPRRWRVLPLYILFPYFILGFLRRLFLGLQSDIFSELCIYYLYYIPG